MIDAGYVASEVRGTVVVDAARNLALPLLDDVFFEFAPVDGWDGGARETVLLHELEHGHSYYVFVTTFAGLVRYDMNDVMRVTGRVGRTPTLEFVRKGRGVTNITGEKMTEDQLNAAVSAVAAALGIRVPFHLAVADAAAGHYRAYIESDDAGFGARDTLANLLDSKLASLNIEYSAKRASGRLPPLQVIAVRAGTGRAYREHCVRKGQRDSQFKVLTLQTAAELDFDFAPHHADERPDASARR
jgi:GH3 auxin-responsive promoter